MSVSISYYSQSSVSVHLSEQLKAEADGLAHQWWNECMTFFDDPTGAGRAYGNTKIFLLGYTTPEGDFIDVPPDDDSAMAWRDAAFITEQLEKWSRAHGISWQVVCEGSIMGAIVEGQRDRSLSDFLASMREICEFEEPLTQERMSRMETQHANRWN